MDNLTYTTACKAILASDKANGYAKAYANAGLTLETTKEREVQALYILNNITHWRSAEATAVRKFFKAYAGVK